MRLRNIKFKAKRLDNGEWVKGSLVKTPFGTFIEWYEDSICNKREVNPDTICQFTGLKDCKGNEVWEHDIIKNPNTGKECTIIWNDYLCCFSALDEIKSAQSSVAAFIESFVWYVIGNKFDKE